MVVTPLRAINHDKTTPLPTIPVIKHTQDPIEVRNTATYGTPHRFVFHMISHSISLINVMI